MLISPTTKRVQRLLLAALLTFGQITSMDCPAALASGEDDSTPVAAPVSPASHGNPDPTAGDEGAGPAAATLKPSRSTETQGAGDEWDRKGERASVKENRVAVFVPQSETADSAASDEILYSEGWKQLYELGASCYAKRDYGQAESKLLAAIKGLKHGLMEERKLVETRLLLADVYLATDKIEEAEKLYNSCQSMAKHTNGAESEEEAHAQTGLAATLLYKGRFAEAHQLCKQALKIRSALYAGKGTIYGQTLITMGRILSAEGFNEQAEHCFVKGLALLDTTDGANQDFADALRQYALVKEKMGQQAEAQTLFDRCYAIKDSNVHFNQTANLKGSVFFKWEEGSPRSQEIPDAIVPLRYICSNNIRVACTVIDLWELFGVLISVTNVGGQKQQIGLGKVSFSRVSDDITDPREQRLELIAPDHIDRIRREMDIWRLTYNRPWLANMQKTRNIRGLVPAHGHDLFRGPNVFGIYGNWNATARVLPDKFQLEPSPENVEEQAQVIVDPSLVRSSDINVLGLIPVSLEPFESRTGEQFYMNPRCEHVLLRVVVGNTTFQFPFKMPRKRTVM